MSEYINCEYAYDYNTLVDWFINSVSDTDKPIWTKKHLEELFNDFYVIPKDTPKADVAEVKHGKWKSFGYKWECSNCRSRCNLDGTPVENGLNYCPNCGAKMDKE